MIDFHTFNPYGHEGGVGENSRNLLFVLMAAAASKVNYRLSPFVGRRFLLRGPR